jgi:sugar phosphate isomerase/epimerase
MQIGISSMALLPKFLEPGIQLIREKRYNSALDSLSEDISQLTDFELLFLNWVYESLDFAQMNDFKFCEVILENPLNARPLVQDFLIQICNQFTIKKTVHAPFLNVNLISIDSYIKKASIQEYLDALDFAAKIGAQKITIHPGKPTSNSSAYQEYYNQSFLEAITEIGNYYAQNHQDQFDLCIENMPSMEQFFMQPQTIRDFFDSQPFQNFHLTLDTAHAWTCGGDAIIEEFVEKFPDKLAHVHIVDNNSFTDDPHLEVGIGQINFEQFIAHLKDISYDGTLTIEIYGRNVCQRSREIIQSYIDS